MAYILFLLTCSKTAFCQGNIVKYPLLQAYLEVKAQHLCVYTSFNRDLSDSLKRLSALNYINDSVNNYSHTMMLELQLYHYEAYKTINDSVKIMQYFIYLKNCYCNDGWSFLTLQEQRDKLIGRSIIRLGKNALPYLGIFMKDTRRTGVCNSSEGQTLSNGYKVRIKDFSYRYAAIILGEQPIFLRKPEERDKVIDAFVKKYLEYFKNK